MRSFVLRITICHSFNPLSPVGLICIIAPHSICHLQMLICTHCNAIFRLSIEKYSDTLRFNVFGEVYELNKPSLQEVLKERILILDGAMGTMIQQEDLSAEDFGGPDLDGCNEMLVIHRPDVIQKIHEQYLEAGADLIETNTFGATSVVLAEYDIPELAEKLT